MLAEIIKCCRNGGGMEIFIMKKQYAVLGLGSFGWSVALTLENMGCDVLVVDDSYEKIQEISEEVAYAIKADVSDPEALQGLGGRNLDVWSWLCQRIWRPVSSPQCSVRKWASPR